jgi:predicted Na+-dependent transporter
MISKLLIPVVLCVLASNIQAGEIARGQVEEVVNIIGSEKLFGVILSASASGVCAGKWIRFKEINFGDNSESYKFAFSMATTAVVSGKNVRVHNYSSDSCDGATFIGLYK